MATQWTAGLTDNTVLPASTLNTIGAAWETWTPVVAQGTTTFAITARDTCRYARINKIIIATAAIVISSGTGQASTQVTMSIPIAPLRTVYTVSPGAWLYDASTATGYNLIPFGIASTSTMGFIGDATGGNGWGVAPAIQLTTSDEIRAIFMYEAA